MNLIGTHRRSIIIADRQLLCLIPVEQAAQLRHHGTFIGCISYMLATSQKRLCHSTA